MKKVGMIGKVEVFESPAVPDNEAYIFAEKHLGNVPRSYQKAVFDNIVKKGIPLPSQRFGRHPYTVGIDMGEPGGDKTVISHALRGKNGIVKIWFDEYADFPNYKWYRNPIKWFKFRKVMKLIERNYKR